MFDFFEKFSVKCDSYGKVSRKCLFVCTHMLLVHDGRSRDYHRSASCIFFKQAIELQLFPKKFLNCIERMSHDRFQVSAQVVELVDTHV